MSLVSRQELRQMLHEAIEASVQIAQVEMAEQLPRDVALELGALGQAGKESALDSILHHLYRDGSFPKVVNVAVRGVGQGKTVIWLGPSGDRFVRELSEAWSDPHGTGPFKPVGLMLEQCSIT
jgi:hypothetical protein